MAQRHAGSALLHSTDAFDLNQCIRIPAGERADESINTTYRNGNSMDEVRTNIEHLNLKRADKMRRNKPMRGSAAAAAAASSSSTAAATASLNRRNRQASRIIPPPVEPVASPLLTPSPTSPPMTAFGRNRLQSASNSRTIPASASSQPTTSTPFSRNFEGIDLTPAVLEDLSLTAVTDLHDRLRKAILAEMVEVTPEKGFDQIVVQGYKELEEEKKRQAKNHSHPVSSSPTHSPSSSPSDSSVAHFQRSDSDHPTPNLQASPPFHRHHSLSEGNVDSNGPGSPSSPQNSKYQLPLPSPAATTVKSSSPSPLAFKPHLRVHIGARDDIISPPPLSTHSHDKAPSASGSTSFGSSAAGSTPSRFMSPDRSKPHAQTPSHAHSKTPVSILLSARASNQSKQSKDDAMKLSMHPAVQALTELLSPRSDGRESPFSPKLSPLHNAAFNFKHGMQQQQQLQQLSPSPQPSPVIGLNSSTSPPRVSSPLFTGGGNHRFDRFLASKGGTDSSAHTSATAATSTPITSPSNPPSRATSSHRPRSSHLDPSTAASSRPTSRDQQSSTGIYGRLPRSPSTNQNGEFRAQAISLNTPITASHFIGRPSALPLPVSPNPIHALYPSPNANSAIPPAGSSAGGQWLLVSPHPTPYNPHPSTPGSTNQNQGRRILRVGGASPKTPSSTAAAAHMPQGTQPTQPQMMYAFPVDANGQPQSQAQPQMFYAFPAGAPPLPAHSPQQAFPFPPSFVWSTPTSTTHSTSAFDFRQQSHDRLPYLPSPASSAASNHTFTSFPYDTVPAHMQTPTTPSLSPQPPTQSRPRSELISKRHSIPASPSGRSNPPRSQTAGTLSAGNTPTSAARMKRIRAVNADTAFTPQGSPLPAHSPSHSSVPVMMNYNPHAPPMPISSPASSPLQVSNWTQAPGGPVLQVPPSYPMQSSPTAPTVSAPSSGSSSHRTLMSQSRISPSPPTVNAATHRTTSQHPSHSPNRSPPAAATKAKVSRSTSSPSKPSNSNPSSSSSSASASASSSNGKFHPIGQSKGKPAKSRKSLTKTKAVMNPASNDTAPSASLTHPSQSYLKPNLLLNLPLPLSGSMQDIAEGDESAAAALSARRAMGLGSGNSTGRSAHSTHSNGFTPRKKLGSANFPSNSPNNQQAAAASNNHSSSAMGAVYSSVSSSYTNPRSTPSPSLDSHDSDVYGEIAEDPSCIHAGLENELIPFPPNDTDSGTESSPEIEEEEHIRER